MRPDPNRPFPSNLIFRTVSPRAAGGRGRFFLPHPDTHPAEQPRTHNSSRSRSEVMMSVLVAERISSEVRCAPASVKTTTRLVRASRHRCAALPVRRPPPALATPANPATTPCCHVFSAALASSSSPAVLAAPYKPTARVPLPTVVPRSAPAGPVDSAAAAGSTGGSDQMSRAAGAHRGMGLGASRGCTLIRAAIVPLGGLVFGGWALCGANAPSSTPCSRPLPLRIPSEAKSHGQEEGRCSPGHSP